MKLKLTIRLGNEGMERGPQIAAALRKIADLVDGWGRINVGDGRVILDENGNTVGHWGVKEGKHDRLLG